MPSKTYQLILSAMTHTGKVRANNEDAYLLYDLESDNKLRPGGCEGTTVGKGVVLIVSDGMGGANAGEVASAIAIKAIIDHLRDHASEKPIEQSQDSLKLLNEAIVIAHEKILLASLDDEAREGMGATVTVLWVSENQAWLGQVGDSRLYKINKNAIEQISEDQSPVGEMLREGKLTVEEARLHPHRNILSQAMGAGLATITPHCEAIDFNEGDVFMLCSDGLSDALPEAALYNIITADARGSLPTACKYLINAANEEYGQDNITLALCRIAKPL